jgi:capsular polysaccharide biosynthesis protein
MRANADMNEKRIGGVSVIQNAIVPTKPARPGLFYSMVGGLVGGAALGIGLALLSQWLSQKLWHPRQVRERLDLPLLGTIGFLPPSARNDGMSPMLMPPGSPDGRKLLGPSRPAT